VGAGDCTQRGKTAQARKTDELLDIDIIGPPGFGIGDIGKPFDFGRDFGEIAELSWRQAGLVNRDEVR
jgi:hypothetical protein